MCLLVYNLTQGRNLEKRRYKLPIQGAILVQTPLTGVEDNPIRVMPLSNLPNCPKYYDEASQEERERGCCYTCLDYNIDEEWCEVELTASEEFHNWLTGMLPQLRGIQKSKGWKLDKSKLEVN